MEQCYYHCSQKLSPSAKRMLVVVSSKHICSRNKGLSHVCTSSVPRQKGLSVYLNSNQLDPFASKLTTCLMKSCYNNQWQETFVTLADNLDAWIANVIMESHKWSDA